MSEIEKHAIEVARGERFTFGDNWAQFLLLLNEERIVEAVRSLKEMLGVSDLQGKTFLDVGSGSGLLSLAARKLGAQVHSFDYDPQSVACTTELKRRYFPDDKDWLVETGSVLDTEYLAKLGQFDIVYSWGVLHHTGRMWQALDNVAPLVAGEGRLFIALYNDQGRASRSWKLLKQLYNKYEFLRLPLAVYTLFRQWSLTFIRDTLRGNPLGSWNNYHTYRGMSAWRDVIDWIGGYPFEVSKPEEIFDFYRDKGFELVRLKTCAGGLGCNEFVFIKKPIAEDN
ncbi:MAG: class I SAM-dependent methyltransferase [Methylococcaceae bacterium]|nr:class I SAM-dependent methyltransferase [Methylococcaceae bacterium]MDP3904961.1 class I SAM-dependent methyltransferase [Methylococcaceae bacterium]